jgi:hypothetical protein
MKKIRALWKVIEAANMEVDNIKKMGKEIYDIWLFPSRSKYV